MVDRVGQQLGNYQLISLLGAGGFAEVYLSEHIHLGTQAAIKVLHTQLTSDDVDKFRTEARTIARLIHPHIVRVLEFGVEGNTPFLVMDYAPNGTLRQRHPKGVALPLPLIVAYVKQVADALQYAHDEKLIHRDIKPENMLLGRRNEILLSDFGIALVAQSSRYQSAQEMAGTMAYMAPEQIQGKPRPASDQYSLGIVVYEWLSGDRPFNGSLTELVGQHLSVLPPSLQEKGSMISLVIEQVVLKSLEKDVHRRFESVQAFAIALEQACQSEPTTSVELSKPNRPLLVTDLVEAILSTQLPQPTNVVTPPGNSSQLPIEAVTPSPAPTILPPPMRETIPSDRPQELQPTQRRISRRAVVIGLAGLTAVGSSLTWLALSQKPQASLPSLHPTATTPLAPSPSPPSLGTTLVNYRGHSSGVNDLVWSPNGMRIASCSYDTTVQIWDAASGNTLLTYRGHSGPVWAVAYSPDGKRIASAGGELNVNQGSHDHAVRVWDSTTQQLIFTYSGHSDAVLN
jgi:eukaryotic-like serine/threonine-protein kinase